MANLLLKTAERAARLLPRRARQSLYKLGPLTTWIRQMLNRAAPRGLTKIRVASGAAEGLSMMLNLQREKDYWLGNYETELLDAVPKYLQPGMTVYDIGANIGYLSLVFACAAGPTGRIFAFEALPDNIDRLTAHVNMNAFSDRIQVIHAAVVDTTGPVAFMVHSSHGMGKAAGSAGRDADYERHIEVDGIAIDDFIFRDGSPAPDLVKMDIEGGEVLALKGMQRTLREHRPIVLLELHGQEAAAAAWDSFKQAQYALFSLGAGMDPIETLAGLDWKAYVLAQPARAS